MSVLSKAVGPQWPGFSTFPGGQLRCLRGRKRLGSGGGRGGVERSPAKPSKWTGALCLSPWLRLSGLPAGGVRADVPQGRTVAASSVVRSTGVTVAGRTACAQVQPCSVCLLPTSPPSPPGTCPVWGLGASIWLCVPLPTLVSILPEFVWKRLAESPAQELLPAWV